jgi:hypothetical protein
MNIKLSVVFSKRDDKKYSDITPFIGNSDFASGIAFY